MTISFRSTNLARWWRLAIAASVAGIIAIIDQATKAVALTHLSQTDRIPLLGDFFGLRLAFNAGTVMSLGSGSTWVISGIAFIATILLFFIALRTTSTAWAVAVGFVWGGGLGNLTDRLLAPPSFGQGHVTDFLAYGQLFIGNLADIAIGIGVGLAVLLSLRLHRGGRLDERGEHVQAELRDHSDG